ncbi:MAG: type II toxin-antitoxin system VapC family toxin [Acidimicrobiia bacterium]
MSIYVDASALLKRYVDEPDRDAGDEILLADTEWVTARHTFVEVHRNLARLLEGSAFARARDDFVFDWERMIVVELDEPTCDRAAELAVTLGVRTLDALHLAAAQRVGGPALPFVTYDLRQAQAARSLGWQVLGS